MDIWGFTPHVYKLPDCIADKDRIYVVPLLTKYPLRNANSCRYILYGKSDTEKTVCLTANDNSFNVLSEVRIKRKHPDESLSEILSRAVRRHVHKQSKENENEWMQSMTLGSAVWLSKNKRLKINSICSAHHDEFSKLDSLSSDQNGYFQLQGANVNTIESNVLYSKDHVCESSTFSGPEQCGTLDPELLLPQRSSDQQISVVNSFTPSKESYISPLLEPYASPLPDSYALPLPDPFISPLPESCDFTSQESPDLSQLESFVSPSPKACVPILPNSCVSFQTEQSVSSPPESSVSSTPEASVSSPPVSSVFSAPDISVRSLPEFSIPSLRVSPVSFQPDSSAPSPLVPPFSSLLDSSVPSILMPPVSSLPESFPPSLPKSPVSSLPNLSVLASLETSSTGKEIITKRGFGKSLCSESANNHNILESLENRIHTILVSNLNRKQCDNRSVNGLGTTNEPVVSEPQLVCRPELINADDHVAAPSHEYHCPNSSDSEDREPLGQTKVSEISQIKREPVKTMASCGMSVTPTTSNKGKVFIKPLQSLQSGYQAGNAPDVAKTRQENSIRITPPVQSCDPKNAPIPISWHCPPTPKPVNESADLEVSEASSLSPEVPACSPTMPSSSLNNQSALMHITMKYDKYNVLICNEKSMSVKQISSAIPVIENEIQTLDKDIKELVLKLNEKKNLRSQYGAKHQKLLETRTNKENSICILKKQIQNLRMKLTQLETHKWATNNTMYIKHQCRLKLNQLKEQLFKLLGSQSDLPANVSQSSSVSRATVGSNAPTIPSIVVVNHVAPQEVHQITAHQKSIFDKMFVRPDVHWIVLMKSLDSMGVTIKLFDAYLAQLTGNKFTVMSNMVISLHNMLTQITKVTPKYFEAINFENLISFVTIIAKVLIHLQRLPGVHRIVNPNDIEYYPRIVKLIHAKNFVNAGGALVNGTSVIRKSTREQTAGQTCQTGNIASTISQQVSVNSMNQVALQPVANSTSNTHCSTLSQDTSNSRCVEPTTYGPRVLNGTGQNQSYGSQAPTLPGDVKISPNANRQLIENGWFPAQRNGGSILLPPEHRTLKITNVQTIPQCANCGQAANQQCSTCYNIAYCSIPCQFADWSRHKQNCVRR